MLDEVGDGSGVLLVVGAASVLEGAALLEPLVPGRLFASRVVASAQKAMSKPACPNICQYVRKLVSSAMKRTFSAWQATWT